MFAGLIVLLLVIAALPSVQISHRVTPNDQTSEAVVNSLLRIDSIAIHLSGRRAVWVLTYAPWLFSIRDMPKSVILRHFLCPIRMFLHARSRWTTLRLARYSCRNVNLFRWSYGSYTKFCMEVTQNFAWKLHKILYRSYTKFLYGSYTKFYIEVSNFYIKFCVTSSYTKFCMEVTHKILCFCTRENCQARKFLLLWYLCNHIFLTKFYSTWLRNWDWK